MNDEEMRKLKILLTDMYDLGRRSGIAEHQYDCVADDYDGECWFEDIKDEFAIRYGVETDYDDEWEPWDKADDLNYGIYQKIRDEVYQLIK